MINERLIAAAATGARKAGVHALRAAGEMVSAMMAFATEIGDALRDDDDDTVERIPVEPEDEE